MCGRFYYEYSLADLITEDYPPVYFWYGRDDLTLNLLCWPLQGPALSKALAAHGVPYKEVVYDHAAMASALAAARLRDGWLDEAAASGKNRQNNIKYADPGFAAAQPGFAIGDIMEFLAFLYTVLLVAICLMMALLLYRSAKPAANRDDAERKEWLRQQLEAQNRQMDAKLAEMAQQNLAAMGHISETLQASVQSMSTALAAGQAPSSRPWSSACRGWKLHARKLEEMRRTLAEGMTALQAQNAQKLDEIRHTVDEQLQDALQKRVTESFKAVNDQLEQVYKGLGEMQNLAADVGGLKQVLSGVKTRGILGEIQLGAILEEILAPEQYDTNVATIPGSTQRVEYAIRMPGADGGTVWLPIDSKFPGDTYAHLQDAQASGDAQAVENARHALELVLRAEAKDIREKIV